MAFDIVIPSEQDAPIISDLHIRAMDANLLTHAQFPNQQAMGFFRTWLTENTIQCIKETGKEKGVLIARDQETGQVASFVKWFDYGEGGELSMPPGLSIEEEFPDFCGRAVLDEYAQLTAGTRKQLMGKKPYYRTLLGVISSYFFLWFVFGRNGRSTLTGENTDVTFLCTDPNWGGRGAASKLLRRLEDMAAAEGKEMILEGVMPAVPLYKKLGFEIRQELHMMLPPRGSCERTEEYLEQSMVWTPPPTKAKQ